MPAFLNRELQRSIVRYLIFVIVLECALLDKLQAAKRLDGLIRLIAGRRCYRTVRDRGIGVELTVILGGRVEQFRVMTLKERARNGL